MSGFLELLGSLPVGVVAIVVGAVALGVVFFVALVAAAKAEPPTPEQRRNIEKTYLAQRHPRALERRSRPR